MIPEMKTGRSILVENDEHTMDSSMLIKIQSIMLTFMERATVYAATYVSEGNRNTLTGMDIVYALKYCAHTFFQEPDLESSIDATLTKLCADEDESSEDENQDENQDEIQEETEDEDPFVRIETTNNPLIQKMNQYVDEWNDWVPTDEVEQMVKRAIDKMEIKCQSSLG